MLYYGWSSWESNHGIFVLDWRLINLAVFEQSLETEDNDNSEPFV
mgnify:CR=1 FL=1